MSRLVISLTTIPPRFPVVHENLQSLLKQTADVAAIELYIPRKYRRFDYSEDQLPKLPDGVELRLVDEDFGPATKVLPACRAYAGQDVQILFCDDDIIYEPEWAQRFVDAAKDKPDCCIIEQGNLLNGTGYSDYDWQSPRLPKPGQRVKGFSYRARRALSLGRWKPSKVVTPGYVDILEGWGGVMVRPEFFSDRAYDIPDILWTVDDVWLSGNLELDGIGIWQHAYAKFPPKPNSDEVKEAALRLLVYKGHDRVQTNLACIDYFRDTYGIWGGTKRV